MKIEVICSTMNGCKPLFLKKGFRPEITTIINQCKYDVNTVDKFENFFEMGLSKSRNRGLNASKCDICLIADNDIYYKDSAFRIITSAFEEYPDADIITFMIETPEGEPFKNYNNKKMFWHTKFTLARVSSIEIAFRRKSIIENNINFDERFGLGSEFPTGEEYIFLNDALRAGLKIAFVPKVIVYHPKESSGGQFNNVSLIAAKGAMIYRIFGLIGLPICLLFSLKKFRKSSFSLLSFLKIILIGYFKAKKYE